MSTTAAVYAWFSYDNCSGTPWLVNTKADFDCSSSEYTGCQESVVGSTSAYFSFSCTDDKHATISDLFGTQEFVGYDYYDDSACTNYDNTFAIAATETCIVIKSNQSARAQVFDDGSVELNFYDESEDCSAGEYPYNIQAAALTASSCLTFGSSSGSIYFTRESLNASSGISTGALIGIIAGGVVFLLLVAGLGLWYCRRRRRFKDQAYQESLLEANAGKSEGQTQFTTESTMQSALISGEMGAALWQDDVIVSSRVPREKVIFGQLISRGGYGEVFRGTYNDRDVAIKLLLPETRRSLKHVNAFLAEVKLMAALEHSHIVQFVGVAWDSLNDVCVLSEFMAGGDLRALLVHYADIQHPVGFDHDKVKIALHVAHALTYLHSLLQPVIHRDLKSKNVLLTADLDAKLTDFGISREHEDRTMTAGVGTSLWMAPEVMLGERYDETADMFSFGVLLSELDTHALPYANAKENSDTGRSMPDAAILQMVALGKLRVQFSAQALPEVVELGLACVATDPKGRPSAAEALYRLQRVLQQLRQA